MKILTLIFLLSASLNAIAQKKTISNRASEMATTKTKALVFFKNTYVEQNFKDPYSYKLLKAEIRPILSMEWYKDSLSLAVINHDIVDTLTITNNYRSLKGKHSAILEKMKNIKANGAAVGAYEDSEQEEIALSEDLERAVQNYKISLNRIVRLNAKINTMSAKEKTELKCYEVNIDCYANNSYGNPILGKYSFEYSLKTGLIGPVVQLNRQ